MVGVGVTGALGQNLITQAFRRAPASVIAPFEYTALVWGVLLDLAIWHVLPDGITLIGGTIVIGAGLFLIERERRAAAVSEAAAGPASRSPERLTISINRCGALERNVARAQPQLRFEQAFGDAATAREPARSFESRAHGLPGNPACTASRDSDRRRER